MDETLLHQPPGFGGFASVAFERPAPRQFHSSAARAKAAA
jgi:hypothetical protein